MTDQSNEVTVSTDGEIADLKAAIAALTTNVEANASEFDTLKDAVNSRLDILENTVKAIGDHVTNVTANIPEITPATIAEIKDGVNQLSMRIFQQPIFLTPE